MPQNKSASGSPQDWLARARGDLAIAKAPLPDGAFYEDLCFHAQQAAEKALKAVYRHYGLPFRYTHDLDELITGLKSNSVSVPPIVDDAATLSSFAWEARYPSLNESILQEEYQEAVRQAETVVAWAEKTIILREML